MNKPSDVSRHWVLGGTYEQAAYVKRHILPNATIISDPQELFGLRGGVLHLCGTWYDRRDFDKREAIARGIKIEEVIE